ncbi:UDP-glycosyltransferase 72B1 [Raphanus sativus]|uniref:Glycosyltransferase n=1 Tax=Raphanus sativus TaxID=3726 RepID=A0A6J0KXJ8_RAPSA|nr:UDP-glycosyltransferase 72B1 [Raphanus sativus]KAJ4876691.1 UDP-glycosyltransferase 72B1 [Raphanus sativus]
MEESKVLHVAIIPSPGMGHLIPLVQFAKRLVQRHGFSVTFIVVGEGPPSKAQRTVLDSLPSSFSSVFLPPADLTDLPPTARIETRISLTVSRSNPELRRTFETFAAESRLPTVLVVDLFGTDAFDVAAEFHVSPYIFFPSTANVLSFFLHFPKLAETMSCEFGELTEPVKLPGCVPLSGKDVLDPAQDRTNDAYKWLLHNTKRYKKAEGILVNTFVELEPNAIKALQLQEPGLDKPPVYPIGPLVNIGKQEGSNGVEEAECLKWLDKQPLGSVLYVSFGSGGALTLEQLNELALGLADSEQRFLWVIRSPSQVADASFFNSHSESDPLTYLPPGFLERTKGRGFMIPSWAPQAQILAHPSTGGFLTHCGWNSTLESIVSGVPLIAWPLYAEQKMNAVSLSEDIRVALRAHAGEDGVVKREEVVRVVKGLMEGEEGKCVRNKMKEMKEGASRVLSDDGSSTKALSLAALKWKDHQKGLVQNGKH